MSDRYRTIRLGAERTLKIQGSRFLAFVAHAESKDAAMAEVERRRTTLHDATHHPFAYRVATDGGEFRAVDDGEPSGSAGRPILAAIDREQLTNVVVVVTRYFGGTKLGVGGLARAYGEAAAMAVAASEREERTILVSLAVAFPHASVGPVMHVVTKAGGKVVSSVYDEEVHLTIEVSRSACDQLFALLVDSTRGAVRREAEGG
jgi:uncharacterized YigZ family protein